MRTPRVSVVLPNLNNRRFLVDRLDSIVNQTLEDWELVIVDSFSDDGAWELIQEYAARDPRIRASQAPREGIYPGLNRCIEQAVGEYVYIATSDDTMDPTCLETMALGLDEHRECDICHTPLRVIDERGDPIDGVWRKYPVARFLGPLIDQPHIRRAPFDGVLHCAVVTVFSSLTQILIRRSVFEKVGLFRNDWGPEGDFEWGMRAALVSSTLYLPEEVATWRRYELQATAQVGLASEARFGRLADMVSAALDTLPADGAETLRRIPRHEFCRPYRQLQLQAGLDAHEGKIRKLWYLAGMGVSSPDTVIHRFRGAQSPQQYARELMERLGLEDRVVPLGGD